MMMSLKVAVVTGATSGIGRAAAIKLARDGFHIVVCGRNEARGALTISAVEKTGGLASFHRLDVTREADWAALASQVIAEHGRLDVLVNCAGTFFSKPLPETSLEEFRALWSADVESVVLGTKYALRMMRDTRCEGSIINISSLAGLIGLEDCAAYCAAKAAVVHFSRVAALEGSQLDPAVRVNALCPGVIWTEMITDAYGDSDAVRTFTMDGNALQRVGEATDIANGIAYLAGSASRRVTGSVLVIDGGRGSD